MTIRREELSSFHERQLSPAEAAAYLDAPVTEVERAEIRALVSWFLRRYPTPVERFAYVRRAYRRWQRSKGIAAERPI
jgi:hypothetical protein